MELLTHHTREKASGMISPPAGCREELQIPRSRDDGGGRYSRIRGFLIEYLGFLHQGLLIGEGERPGGGQGAQTIARRGAGPPAPRVGLAPPAGLSGSPLDFLFPTESY